MHVTCVSHACHTRVASVRHVTNPATFHPVPPHPRTLAATGSPVDACGTLEARTRPRSNPVAPGWQLVSRQLQGRDPYASSALSVLYACSATYAAAGTAENPRDRISTKEPTDGSDRNPLRMRVGSWRVRVHTSSARGAPRVVGGYAPWPRQWRDPRLCQSQAGRPYDRHRRSARACDGVESRVTSHERPRGSRPDPHSPPSTPHVLCDAAAPREPRQPCTTPCETVPIRGRFVPRSAPVCPVRR